MMRARRPLRLDRNKPIQSDGSCDGVVLLHGMGRSAASMGLAQRVLAGQGYRILNVGYESRRKSLEGLAEDVDPAIAPFAASLDGRIHFVTHSMGGLLARRYIAGRRPARMGRVVMLGPPNNGSEVADLLHRTTAYRSLLGPAGQQLTTAHAAIFRDVCGPIDYDLGVIAGTRCLKPLSSVLGLREPNDGKVTVRSTRLDGMSDHIALPAHHAFMMRNPAVLAATIAFLRDGRFG